MKKFYSLQEMNDFPMKRKSYRKARWKNKIFRWTNSYLAGRKEMQVASDYPNPNVFVRV